MTGRLQKKREALVRPALTYAPHEKPNTYTVSTGRLLAARNRPSSSIAWAEYLRVDRSPYRARCSSRVIAPVTKRRSCRVFSTSLVRSFTRHAAIATTQTRRGLVVREAVRRTLAPEAAAKARAGAAGTKYGGRSRLPLTAIVRHAPAVHATGTGPSGRRFAATSRIAQPAPP